ncbi:MAG: hypothetical protein JO294_04250 [Alphaproteobacteria bacterium]|nr:hypothetical protein [Alphaproteobacteria bacterium]
MPLHEEAPVVRDSSRIASAGLAFYLRSIRAMARLTENDLTATIVFNAMWAANTSEIAGTALTHQYRELDNLPPDSLRRPITVLALSNSLHMPYETVRRHVRILSQSGSCVSVPRKGWYVPAHALGRSQMLAELAALWPSLLKFVDDLRGFGFDFAPVRHRLPQTVPCVPTDEPPPNIRPMVRVAMDFVLRCVEMMGILHERDFLAGLVFAAVWARHVLEGGANARASTAGSSWTRTEPIAASVIAKDLGLPYETIRRAVLRLASAGHLEREEGGVVMSASELESGRIAWALAQLCQQVARFVGGLHKAGFSFETCAS